MKLYGQYGIRYYVCNMLNFSKNFNTQFLNALGLVILYALCTFCKRPYIALFLKYVLVYFN